MSFGAANPLSNYSTVKQTWVDGRKYFDRAEDAEARKTFAAQHQALVQKALPERMKELSSEKQDDSKDKPGEKEKPPAREKHRAHELKSLYGNGRNGHSCTEGHE